LKAASVTGVTGSALPALALLLNALVWGVSWWPFRLLQAQGLHPLWTTALIYTLAVAALTLWRPAAWKELVRDPALWLIVMGSGITNSSFNWGVTFGDVVRVILLFYLMPVWTALLARGLLGERITATGLVRIALGLAGAAIVLWPAGGGMVMPSASDLLGVLGGFAFALNNVMLRRLSSRSQPARAMAMFFGGAAVSALLACTFSAAGSLPWPQPLAPAWIAFAVMLGVAFLAANLSLQYGVTRLRANATSLILLTEVLFATGSAVLLGAASLTPGLALGGSLIVGAALLAALSRG
jgi:drug/metabolite transporter (DMT)-like permease